MKALLIILANISLWWLMAWLTLLVNRRKSLPIEFQVAYTMTLFVGCGAAVFISGIIILHTYAR